MEKPYMWLSDGQKKSVAAAADMLRVNLGVEAYQALLHSVGASGFGALATVIRLWEDAFELKQAATGRDNYYVQVRGG